MSGPEISPETKERSNADRAAEDTAGHIALDHTKEPEPHDPLLGPADVARSFSSRPPPQPRVRVAALAKGREPSRLDHLIGALLVIVYVAALLFTSSGLGMNRDEGFYVDAAESYAGWWDGVLSGEPDAFDRARIDRAWENNHEHPSLPKSLFAFSWLAQQRWHPFPEDSMAFRFPGMVMSALALWVLYLFGTRIHGRRAGLVVQLDEAREKSGTA